VESVKSWSISVIYCITSFDFCYVHRNWSHRTSLWSSGMPLVCVYKAFSLCIQAFLFSCMRWQRVLSLKHDCATGSQPAWISWHHCDAAAVYSFWRISSLAFTNIFECVKPVNVNVTTLNYFSSGGLSLPATHFTSICRIIALHILHFIPRAKDFY